MKNTLQILSAAQAILARHLPPDGITEQECISELLALLDSPLSATLTQPIRDAKDALAKRKETAANLLSLVSTASERPLKNASGEVAVSDSTPPDMASPEVRTAINAEAEISCLRDELIRVGNNEHHLLEKCARIESELTARDNHIAEIHRIAEDQALIIERLQARLHRAQNKIQAIATTIASDQ